MPKGVPSLGPGAASLSAALHAAAVGGVLLASLLDPEPWPETTHAAVPQGPMVLDMTATRGNGTATRSLRRIERSRLPRLRPLEASSAATRASAPPSLTSINASGLPIEPIDLLSGVDDSGECTTGCMVGSDDGGGDGLANGRGSATEQVVHIGRGPGGSIRPPIKVGGVPPLYPDLAIRSRVFGHVEIECRIDTTGRVVDAKIRRGHPLLAPAALEAVRQWVYEPTLLNGVPVSVIMTVTVHFRLRG